MYVCAYAKYSIVGSRTICAHWRLRHQGVARPGRGMWSGACARGHSVSCHRSVRSGESSISVAPHHSDVQQGGGHGGDTGMCARPRRGSLLLGAWLTSATGTQSYDILALRVPNSSVIFHRTVCKRPCKLTAAPKVPLCHPAAVHCVSAASLSQASSRRLAPLLGGCGDQVHAPRGVPEGTVCHWVVPDTCVRVP